MSVSTVARTARTGPGRPAPLTPRRLSITTGCWILVVCCGALLASVLLGALAEQRAQRRLLAQVRTDISQSAEAAATPFGVTAPATPARRGSAVGLVQIPRLGRQAVVVEGSRPGETSRGPGHVTGTAGLGQPGNSAVIGRARAYGGVFTGLARLRPGDEIVVTTSQGQSVYAVQTVRVTGADPFAPSADDRLTLVTAGGWWPGADPLVVVARARDLPFPPTPQNGRDTAAEGRTGDRSALPVLGIWLALFAGAAVAATALYRAWLARATYLITTPVLVALLVLAADAAARLLPAWV